MLQSSANSQVVACPQCGAPVTLPDYTDLALCPFCGSTLKREQSRPADEWGPSRRELEDAAPASPSAAAPTPSAAALGTSAAPGTCAAPVAAPSAAAPPGASEHVLHSLCCPQCAGPLSVQTGRRILLCDHCGIRVLLRADGGVSRWLFPQTVDKVHALGAAKKWLADNPGISRQARDVPVDRAQLVHVPIWEHKALVTGWEFGSKVRTQYQLVKDDEGCEKLDLMLTKEHFEDPHLQERRFFQAACDLDALGAARPRFSGRELLLPMVAGEVDPSSTVLEPTGTAAQIAARGRQLALLPVSGAAEPQSRMPPLLSFLAGGLPGSRRCIPHRGRWPRR